MKANKAPEKLYIDFRDRAESTWRCAYAEKAMANDIEYIRTDIFIEKACEFLKSYRQDTSDGTGYIADIVNDKTIEDFRNYMKGE